MELMNSSGCLQQHEVHSLPRSESRDSYNSFPTQSFSSRHSHGSNEHQNGHNRPLPRGFSEPLLSGSAPLLINNKPLEAYAPLGQPDNTGRVWVSVLFALALTQGLAWGCTLALAGRLLEPEQQRGTGISFQAPLIAVAWGVALLVLSPVGSCLVDFRSAKSITVQLAAMSVWWLGGGLLLLPAILEPGSDAASSEMSDTAVVLSWIGFILCAAGSAVERPLLTVLVADQVREQFQRAQSIGLCFACFTAGDIVASVVDAAGASALVLCVLLICAVTLGVGCLFAIRKMVDLETDSVNATTRLWSQFMPSGDGGASEWSDENLLSESGEAPARSCCCAWKMILRRLKRHPLVCGFKGQVEPRHVRTLAKVFLLGALVRATNTCVRWGDEATRMDHHLCLGGDAAPTAPDDEPFVYNLSQSAAFALPGTQGGVDGRSAGSRSFHHSSSPGRGLLAMRWGHDASAHDAVSAADRIDDVGIEVLMLPVLSNRGGARDGGEVKALRARGSSRDRPLHATPSLFSYTDAHVVFEHIDQYARKQGDWVRPQGKHKTWKNPLWVVELPSAPGTVLLSAVGSGSEPQDGSGAEHVGERSAWAEDVPRLWNAGWDDSGLSDDISRKPSASPSARSCLEIGYLTVSPPPPSLHLSPIVPKRQNPL